MLITVFLVVSGRIFYNYNGMLFYFGDRQDIEVCYDI